MNMMRDFTNVVTDPLPSYIADVRRMVREADEPELMASYERCEELEKLLTHIRTILISDKRLSVNFDDVIDDIDDALDPHVVLS